MVAFASGWSSLFVCKTIHGYIIYQTENVWRVAKKIIAKKITYYIHNWSLQPFSQDYWSTFWHQLFCVCVNFIQTWRDLQFKVGYERQIFWETFHGNFNYSLSFCQKPAEAKSPKKYYLYFILMSGMGLESGPWLLRLISQHTAH